MLVFGAQLAAVQVTMLTIAQKAGVTEIEGLGVMQFYEKTISQAREELLLRLENTNPSLAAYIQKELDGRQKKPTSPESGVT